MTNYKNRCAELAQHLDDTLDFTISSETRKYLKALISTVRSELAEPEMEGSTPRPADGEVEELVAWLNDHAYVLNEHGARIVRRAVDLLKQLPPRPISVTERLPGPEDCDAEERCWWGAPALPSPVPASWRFVSAEDRFGSELYWLPANALALPQ